MRKILKGLYRKEEGQILIFTGIIMAVLMGFSAITIDVGMMAIEKSKLQNVADAAALAGAQELPNAGNAKNAAVKYAKENGLVMTTDDVITPVDGDNKKIKVVAAKTVSHTMARMIGINETDVKAAAVANKTDNLPSEFTGYAILSESPTTPLSVGKAGQSTCNGIIHTNNKLNLGKHLEVTRVEASTGITETGKNTIGSRDPASPNVTIPADFKSELLSLVTSAPKKYTGNQNFGGNGLDLNESVYVDGNVTITGNNLTGKGFIYATGDIKITGNNTQIGSAGVPVFIYSEKNILISGNNANMYCVIYAPNGEIDVQKNNWNLYGRMIANSFADACLKNNFDIIAGSGDFSGLPLGNGKIKLIG